jgi:hypothetical protein
MPIDSRRFKKPPPLRGPEQTTDGNSMTSPIRARMRGSASRPLTRRRLRCAGTGDPIFSMKVEAPPGFEPGVEVLQTSALPLGDGAPGDGQRIQRRYLMSRCPAFAFCARSGVGIGSHVAERAVSEGQGPPEQKMERETGFEPATSTLARSHSTTELFPPGEPLNYHEATVRLKPDTTTAPCAERQSLLPGPSD